MLHKLTLFIQRLIALTERYPWAIPVFGFVSGVFSFFMVERTQEFAQFIALFMLVSWIWLSMQKLLHQTVMERFGISLPPGLLHFATQLVHQESLFFVIPFFFITTAWNTGQSVFTSFLMIAAIISVVDPIYFRWLAPRKILYVIYHGLTLFAVLLTALPIVFKMPTALGFSCSLFIAVLISVISLVREFQWRWWQRSLLVIFIIISVNTLGYVVRPWIPPATLWLTQVAITNNIDSENRSPAYTLKEINAAELSSGLYAFTAIHAPRGLNETIYHVWQQDGVLVDKVALDIKGGREAGYRAWTHKVNFPLNPIGNWQIKVVTDADQLIGVLRFRVTENVTAISYPDSTEKETITPEGLIKAPVTDLLEEKTHQD